MWTRFKTIDELLRFSTSNEIPKFLQPETDEEIEDLFRMDKDLQELAEKQKKKTTPTVH